MGRPSKYSKELGARICEQIVAGKSVRRICKADDMPNADTIFSWLVRNKEFSEQYTQAREIQAEMMADELNDIADDGTNDFVEEERKNGTVILGDHEHINRSRLRVDTRKWVLSKLLPKKYGDRLVVAQPQSPDLDLGNIPTPSSGFARKTDKPN